MRRAIWLTAIGCIVLAARPVATQSPYQHYPNIPGEVLFENLLNGGALPDSRSKVTSDRVQLVV